MENNIPVNIPGGVNTIFDGAGEIKDIVSDDSVKQLQERLDEYQTENSASAKSAVQGGQYVDVNEYMRKIRTKPLVRDYKKIGRNDPCPCGSGKKYKNCCLKTGEFETMHQITN